MFNGFKLLAGKNKLKEGRDFMKLERITLNKFKVFIPSDDLLERGLTKEDIWKNIPEVQNLFREVIQEASKELGFVAGGRLSVQILSLQAQGVVIIVSQDGSSSDLDEEMEQEFVEMRVTLDECLDVLFEFDSFEDLIDVALPLYKMAVFVGKVISYDDKFYLHISQNEAFDLDYDLMIAVLSEYGYPAVRTIHRIETYGNIILEQDAIKQLVYYFYPDEIEHEIEMICEVNLSTSTPKQNSTLFLKAIVKDKSGNRLKNVDVSVLLQYKTRDQAYFGRTDCEGKVEIPIKVGRVKLDYPVNGVVSFYYKQSCVEVDVTFIPRK